MPVSSWSSRARAARARRRCCSCSAASTGRRGGELLFEGRDLSRLGDAELTRLRLETFGFVFQQFNLIPTLTARENVEAALAPTGMANAAVARSRSCCSTRSGSPSEPPPADPALGRRAAAGRDRPSARERAAGAARRRADRQPRRRDRRRGAGGAARGCGRAGPRGGPDHARPVDRRRARHGWCGCATGGSSRPRTSANPVRGRGS